MVSPCLYVSPCSKNLWGLVQKAQGSVVQPLCVAQVIEHPEHNEQSLKFEPQNEDLNPKPWYNKLSSQTCWGPRIDVPRFTISWGHSKKTQILQAVRGAGHPSISKMASPHTSPAGTCWNHIFFWWNHGDIIMLEPWHSGSSPCFRAPSDWSSLDRWNLQCFK